MGWGLNNFFLSVFNSFSLFFFKLLFFSFFLLGLISFGLIYIGLLALFFVLQCAKKIGACVYLRWWGFNNFLLAYKSFLNSIFLFFLFSRVDKFLPHISALMSEKSFCVLVCWRELRIFWNFFGLKGFSQVFLACLQLGGKFYSDYIWTFYCVVWNFDTSFIRLMDFGISDFFDFYFGWVAVLYCIASGAKLGLASLSAVFIRYSSSILFV